MPASAQTEAPAKAPTTSYFWVMSVQTPDVRLNTRTAVVEVPAGFTREQLFKYVLDQFAADFGPVLTVLFFDLQPNKL